VSARAKFHQLCRQNFGVFSRRAFEELNTGEDFHSGFHFDAIAHVLNEAQAGERRRQIISMPPRTLKSQMVSVYWSAFLLGHNPATKLITVSYAEDLAELLSNATRRLMQSDFYRSVFPGTVLERQANLIISTTKGGMRYATTIGGSVTGFGADVIILDDPLKASEAESEVARERVKTYYKKSLRSRLNRPGEGVIILVAQRLHEDDLTGHVLETETEDWEHLKLQAVATEAVDVQIGPGRVHTVEVGDLLLPTLLTRKFLDEQRRAVGSADFDAQYQQDPAPADGVMVKDGWLVRGDPPPLSSGRITLSLDTAAKTETRNDYSVCTVWLQADSKHHLIDVWRDKVDFPGLLRRVETLFGQYQPQRVLIEDAGSGIQLIQSLRARGMPALGCKPDKSKIVRLDGVLPYFEAGLVVLPRSATWLDAFVAEIVRFPRGRHDDQVDSVSQYLGYVLANPPSTFNYDTGDYYDFAGHDVIGERLAMGRIW
jgi:predicted phage terminase large subunit-like protein